MFSPDRAIADLSAAALANECDRLAGAPTDPNREGPGVAFDRIDTVAAIESCGQALARNLGNSRVIFNLARANDRAARLYRLAADQGYTAARHSRGVFHLEGLGGLAPDARAAARLFKLAADRGFALSQYNLAVLYASGDGGLVKDEREAARLYKLAADQGDPAAQTDFGAFYDARRGGLPRDEREAARLFGLAAGQGDSVAQFDLGVFYANGRGGLATDEHEAARLYRLAADQGSAPDSGHSLTTVPGGSHQGRHCSPSGCGGCANCPHRLRHETPFPGRRLGVCYGRPEPPRRGRPDDRCTRR